MTDVRPTYTLVPDPQTLTRQDYMALDAVTRSYVMSILTHEASAVYAQRQVEVDHATQVMLGSRAMYLSGLVDWFYTLNDEIRRAERDAWQEANGYFDAPDESAEATFVGDNIVW